MRWNINSDEAVIDSVRSIIDEADSLDDGDMRTALKRAKTNLFTHADVGECHNNSYIYIALVYATAIYATDLIIEDIDCIGNWTPDDGDAYWNDELHAYSREDHEPMIRTWAAEVDRRVRAAKDVDAESEQAFRRRMGLA